MKRRLETAEETVRTMKMRLEDAEQEYEEEHRTFTIFSQRLEKKWEQAEAKVAELQAELADPDVYADTDRVVDLQSKHDAAKDEAARLMGEWEQAATRLEASTP